MILILTPTNFKCGIEFRIFGIVQYSGRYKEGPEGPDSPPLSPFFPKYTYQTRENNMFSNLMTTLHWSRKLIPLHRDFI